MHVEVAGICLQLDESTEVGRSLVERYQAYICPSPAAPAVRVLQGEDGDDSLVRMSRAGAWVSALPDEGRILIGGDAGTADLDRLMMHAFAAVLARRQALLAHGAAVAGPRGAIAFLGPSGAGKTTAARNCPVPVLHKDRVAVGLDEAGPWLAPVPFLYPDRPELGTGRRPLDRILFVSHGFENRLRSLDVAERVRLLLGSILMPSDREGSEGTLDTVERLARTARLDLLEARIDGGFWPTLVADQAVASGLESA